jgi:hypothetical protein
LGGVVSPIGGVVGPAGGTPAVVNDHFFRVVIALPARSFTPVVMVAVYVLAPASGDEDVNIAAFLLGLPASGSSVTVPGIALPALSFSINVEVLTVDLCTGSLNVAIMGDDNETFMARLDGKVLITLGGIVSTAGGTPAVVNDHFFRVVIALPARSFTPVVMVAVYNLEGASGDEGLNTTVSMLGFGGDCDCGIVTVPRIALPALSFSVNVVGLTVDPCTGSLNVATMLDDSGTFVARLDGKVLTTLGGVVSPAGGRVVVPASTTGNKFTGSTKDIVVIIADKIIAAKKFPRITLKVNILYTYERYIRLEEIILHNLS